MNIVIIGCHGVGKTTLGRLTASALGVRFDSEIGEILASNPEMRPQGFTARNRQIEFDRQVFEAELERDHKRMGCGLRVIETWHPGNLAYAQLRSRSVVGMYLDRIESTVRAAPSIIIPLEADYKELKKRKHEPGELSFFLEVANLSTKWAEYLGLTMAKPVRTDRCTEEEALRQILSRITRILCRASVSEMPFFAAQEEREGISP